MWLILFVGGLITSACAGLYTPICAEGGLPVCATNGAVYLYFENECRLNAYIYKQIYLGQRVPLKTDLENCLLNCHEIVCPALFRPVCAQQVPDGPVRTVPNACLVNQLICVTKRHWKVIGEGPCAPTLKSTSLTAEEYSFISPSAEDYLISEPESASTSYTAPSSYTGQEYSSSASGTSLYAVQDQSQNYIESAPAPVPYATPDTVSAPSTYEAPQPAPCSAAASDAPPYIAPAKSQSYQAPSDSLLYIAPDQTQSYQAHAPVPVSIATPYDPLDQSRNNVASTVPVPVPAACPYATALDSASAPYVATDQNQSYVAPAEVPKSYPVLETIPSSAPSEVQQSSQCRAPASSVVSVPYKATDQNQNFPVPAPYMAQDSVSAPYGTQQPATCPYATPTPAPASLPYTALDQSLNYVVPVAQDPSASAPCSATDQSPNYIAPLPAPASYPIQEPVTSPYEAPCPIADVVPAPGPAPCPSLEQAQNYAAGVSAPAPYAAHNAVPAPYEAEQTALYSNAAVPSVPTQSVYSNPAPVAISTPYDVQQTAPCPYAESTPAAAPLSYAAVEQNPAPYVVPNPVVSTNEVQQTLVCPYATSASVSNPATYTVPEQTQTYVAPLPVPVPAPYEAYSSPTVVSATLLYSALDQSQRDEAQTSAPCPNPESQRTAPYSYSPLNTVPSPYAASEQAAPDSASYSAMCQNSAPASAPSEIQQSAPYTYSAPVLTPTAYVSSDPVSAPAPYEVQEPAPYLDTASDPVPVPAVQVPYEVQQPASCASVAPTSAPADLSYTAPDQTQSYLATPPAPISGSNANTETALANQVQRPATCSCTASNQYSKPGVNSPLLSNIYSRLPDLTNLFKHLRRRFGMFVYQPRYTHLIINN